MGIFRKTKKKEEAIQPVNTSIDVSDIEIPDIDIASELNRSISTVVANQKLKQKETFANSASVEFDPLSLLSWEETRNIDEINRYNRYKQNILNLVSKFNSSGLHAEVKDNRILLNGQELHYHHANMDEIGDYYYIADDKNKITKFYLPINAKPTNDARTFNKRLKPSLLAFHNLDNNFLNIPTGNGGKRTVSLREAQAMEARGEWKSNWYLPDSVLYRDQHANDIVVVDDDDFDPNKEFNFASSQDSLDRQNQSTSRQMENNRKADEAGKLVDYLTYGIIGAGASPLLAPIIPLAQPIVVPIAKSIIGSELARYSTKALGGNEIAQTVASYLGGGFGGMGKNLLANGLKAFTIDGLINSSSIAAFDQSAKFLDKTNLPNTWKLPIETATSILTRRGLSNGTRSILANNRYTQNWATKLFENNQNNLESAFSQIGHIQPNYEGSKNLLLKAIVWGGAEGIKYAPTLAGASLTGLVTDYNPTFGTISQFVMPYAQGKANELITSYNRNSAHWLSYASGGTGKGKDEAISNMLKLSLLRPKLMNKSNIKLSFSDRLLGSGIAIKDYFLRNYKPGGYGFHFLQSDHSQGENWGNLTQYIPDNHLINYMFGKSLYPGFGVKILSKLVNLRNNPKSDITYENLAHSILHNHGYSNRYGNRLIQVGVTGNKVNLNNMVYATKFDSKGNPIEWSSDFSRALSRHANYNPSTGHEYMLPNGNVKNIAINTKGQLFIVAKDITNGNVYSVGADLYGVGSGKNSLFSKIMGSFIDAHTNPIITLSFNKYSPTKRADPQNIKKNDYIQSFNSQIYYNIPHYKNGNKLIKKYNLTKK